MPADVDVVRNEEAQRFEARLGAETAFAEYRLVDGAVILPHTVVPDAFEGRGVGGALAQAALAWARAQELKVIPLCPFIAAYMQKHPEFHDLVHETWRGRLGL